MRKKGLKSKAERKDKKDEKNLIKEKTEEEKATE